jgi:uridine kinase
MVGLLIKLTEEEMCFIPPELHTTTRRCGTHIFYSSSSHFCGDLPLVRNSEMLCQNARFDPPVDVFTVAARLENQIIGLNDLIPDDGVDYILQPISRLTVEGNRIYKRSIAFILGAAIRRCGMGPVSIMESVGCSFHFTLPSTHPIDPETASLITNSMRNLTQESLQINKVYLPRKVAIEYFERENAAHTLELLNSTSETHIPCYEIQLGEAGIHRTIAHSVFIPSTKLVEANHFFVDVISDPFPHFRLFYATPSDTTNTLEITPTNEPKLLEAYSLRKNWGLQLGLQSVTHVNKSISDSKTKSVIQLAEALHDHQVVTIASNIVLNSSGNTRPRLVLIAGPSSSGKTTFAKRLGLALETLGGKPTVISVDSYYKAWTDIDPRGMQYVDWESLDSLNLELLNEQLLQLLDGKEVSVPEYDMKTSMPVHASHWVKTIVPSDGIIIMEGIHCLNPQLTSKVPRGYKYHIMISPLSALILDDHNLISSSQVRMLRRMVRDYLFRGRSALSTLRQWSSVAHGERKNIYPNQNNADVVMNSGLIYETHVLKVYAEPLLKTITPDLPEYAEARRLLSMLDKLVAMPSTIVPPQSLLREFIGGSWFYDYGGMYQTA